MLKLKNILLENFIITEFSKNDAIPEISRYDKNLCVFLFGPPASGKTTFVKDFILRLNKNFAIINPDDIDYKLRGKSYKNMRVSKSTKLSVLKTKNVLQSGQNVIYDTTGNDFNRISELSKIAKENNYIIIFIHIFNTLSDILKRAAKRERPTDADYIKSSYDRAQKLINRFYTELQPDSYYIVTTLNNQYKFYKYQNGKLLKKKVDSYK